MSAVAEISFASVQKIALRCASVDSAWMESVKGDLTATEKDSAVRECRERLQKLSGEIHKCSAIHFGAVRHSQQMPHDTLMTKFQSLVIHHQDAKGFRSADVTMSPADEEVADFYLLYDREVLHFQLDPKNPVTLCLEPSDHPWETSTETISNLKKQIWNGAFITAAYRLNEVIPIPI